MPAGPIRVTTDHAAPPLVLVVGGDPSTVEHVTRWLGEAGFRTSRARDLPALSEALSSSVPDLVVLDVDAAQGLPALGTVRRLHATVPIVVLGERGGPTSMADALAAGAYDFVPKPLERAHVLTATRNGCERHRLARKVSALERRAAEEAFAGILGRSAPMRRLFERMNEVAPSHVSVLLRGEAGTGKRRLARAIHEASAHAPRPLLALDCASATEVRREQLDGVGTVVLGHVGQLSPGLQGDLRRALQGTEVRVIATSQRDLGEMVERGTFDRGLYDRLAACELEVPPLRTRGGDIRLLLDRELAQRSSEGALRFDAGALELLLRYPWPGNVTELRALVGRVHPGSEDGWICARHLPESVRRQPSESAAGGVHEALDDEQREAPLSVVSGGGTLADLERAAIERELERCNGNVTAVGRRLGIGRTTLYRRLKQYGLR